MPRGSGNRRVAIVGVGYSPRGKRIGHSLETLTAMACKAALGDAGLKSQDIDGVSVYASPGQAVGSLKIAGMLGVPQLRWYMGTTEGPTFHGAVIPAIDAVASGSSEVCLVVNSMLEAGGSFTKRVPSVTGDSQFTVPFGVHAGPHWISLLMRRHMAQYGTTEEHFGYQAIAQREFAVLNDDAFFRTPLTMADYLNARYICKPCRLLDCDYPVDIGGAVILTTEERARDLRQKPVFLESWAMGSPRVPDSTIMEDMTRPAPWAASEIWGRTDLKPKDVDVASLYDGFIFAVLQWLEALGFCGEGESGPFVAEGHTRPGGSLPVNCDGGAVNAGRTHGTNHVVEVVQQLRGESGPRQTPNARVGMSSNGLGPVGGCLLLTTD